MKQRLSIFKQIKIVWIAASLSLLAMTQASFGKDLKVTYGLYGGGFNVVDIEGTYTITDKTYDLRMDLQTVGMLGKLAPWGGVIHTSGHNKGTESTPQIHSFASTWRNETETTTFRFGQDGQLKSFMREEEDGKIITEMPAAEVYEGRPVDMLSALFRAMNNSSCASTHRTMDGKRSFDMVFRSVGNEKLNPSKYSVFSGDTEICDVEIVPVAGKWREKPRGWMSLQGQAKENGQLPRLWFGKVRDDMPPIPVRFFIKTDYGAMVMHLKAIQG